MVIYPSRKSRFSFWFAFSFILNGYASGIPGLSLGSVVFLFLIFYTLKYADIKRVDFSAFFVFLFFMIISLFDYILTPNHIDVISIIMGISKYVIWASMLSFCASTMFDETITRDWLVKFAMVLLGYLIIQNIAFYGFSIYFPNIFDLGPLHPYAEGYADERHGENFIIRPASFLSESSFLGCYFLCTLIMVLNSINSSYSKSLFKISLLLTFGTLLTSSTSAIIFLPIIWILLGKGCYHYHKRFFRILSIAMLLSLLLIVSVFASFADSDNAILYSLFYTFNKFDQLDSSTRFGSSYEFLNYLSYDYSFLGVGVGNEVPYLRSLVYSYHYYMNSLTTTIFQVGYLGLSFFLLYLLILLKKSHEKKQMGAFVLIGLYLVNGIGSGMWLGTYGVMYMFVAMGYLSNKYLCIQNE